MLQDIKNKVNKLTGKKYLPQEGELQQEGALQYLFILPTVDGGGVPVAYTQNFDENGKPKPLNHQGFLQQWHAKEKNLIEFVAKENGIDPALLYGIVPDAPDTQKEVSIGQDSGVTLLQGGIETTGVSDVANAPKKYMQVAPNIEGTEASFTVMPAPPQSKYTPMYYTGPMGFQKSQAEEEAKRKAAQPQPNLFYISKENIEKSKDVVQASPTVVENNYKETEIENMDVSATAAIASHILATNFASRGLDNMANLSDEAVGEIIEGYFKSNDIALDQAQIKAAVKKVRSYKPETNFPSSKTFDPKAMTLLDRVDTSMLRGSSLHHETWWQYRNERIGEFGSSKKYNTNSDVAKAIEFYQDPEAHMNTALLEGKEEQFQLWLADMRKQGIIHENDNSYDYDYRGYWQKYIDGNEMEPVLEPGMHFPDEFKKPNHPTFSKDSKWARGAWEEYAGTWEGETYTPGRVSYPRAQQDAMQEYIKEYQIEPEDLMFSYGVVKAKEKGAVVDKPEDGTPTGFAADVEDTEAEGKSKTLKYASFEIADPEMAETLKVIYGTTVVNQGGQISTQIYNDVKKLSKKEILEWASVNIAAPVLANWTSYKNSGELFVETPAGVRITKGEVFNFIVNALDETPDEVMLNAFPTIMKPLYEKRREAQKTLKYLLTTEASEEEIAQAKASLIAADKEYLLKSQALQNEFFTSGYTRIATQENVFTMEEAIANGNIDDKAYSMINSYTRGNFNLAWGLHDQILGTDTKVDKGYGDGKTTKSFSAKGYQIWAAVVPGIVPNSSARVHYDKVVDIQWQSMGIKENEFSANKQKVEGFFDELLDRQIRVKGDAFSIAVRSKFDSLVEMYTYLGYAKGEGKAFDANFVKQEIKAFLDTFIMSDKYNVMVDKDSASFAGVKDATQLDAVLMYAKDEAISAAQDGRLSVNLSGTPDALATNEAFKNTAHKIQPVLFGDTIYFMTSGEETNHLVYAKNGKGAPIPYTMSLTEIVQKKDYDAKYYEQLSRRGIILKPRSYLEEMANPDMGIKVGAFSRAERPKVAMVLGNRLSRKYSIEGKSFSAFDDGYHDTVAALQRELSASPTLRPGVNSLQVEKYFLSTLNSMLTHNKDAGVKQVLVGAMFANGKLLVKNFADIPEVKRAYNITYKHFTAAQLSPGWMPIGMQYMLPGTRAHNELVGGK